MRLDHLSFAAGPDGLAATVRRLEDALGASFVDGGIHPRFGTRNMVLPLTHRRYVEVVEVLDHPASDKAVFGQAVRARSELGGGWMGWVVAVDDLSEVERRIGRHAVPGNRHRPDGFNLQWHQIGVRGMQADPQLPYVISWDVPATEHPSASAEAVVELAALEIGGSPHRVEDWLGQPALTALDIVDVEWVAPNGAPGIVAARFTTPSGGVVRI